MNYRKIPSTAKKETNYKLAVLAVDEILEYALTQLNFKPIVGQTRLESAIQNFPSLKKLIWTQKTAKLIREDKNYPLKFGLAKKIIDLHKKALKDIGAW